MERVTPRRVRRLEAAAAEARLWAWAEDQAPRLGRAVPQVVANARRHRARLVQLCQQQPPRLVRGRPDWAPLLRQIGLEEGLTPEHVEREVQRILREWEAAG